MGDNAVDDLVANAHHRIECIHRPLRHQGDFAQPDVAELALRNREQIAAIELDLPADNAPGRPGQPHQCRAHGRLARARLTDQAQSLAWFERERHAVDRFDRAVGRQVVDGQVLDPQDVGHTQVCCRRRGLANRSIPAETKNSPMKIVAIMAIGGPNHHHCPRRTALYFCAQ